MLLDLHFLRESQRFSQNVEFGEQIQILVLSGLATGASWMCYFRALQKGDINKVVPIDKSSTVLTILLALIFLHEGVTEGKLFSVVLIGLGTMLMITRKNSQRADTGQTETHWLTLFDDPIPPLIVSVGTDRYFYFMNQYFYQIDHLSQSLCIFIPYPS